MVYFKKLFTVVCILLQMARMSMNQLKVGKVEAVLLLLLLLLFVCLVFLLLKIMWFAVPAKSHLILSSS